MSMDYLRLNESRVFNELLRILGEMRVLPLVEVLGLNLNVFLLNHLHVLLLLHSY